MLVSYFITETNVTDECITRGEEDVMRDSIRVDMSRGNCRWFIRCFL